MATAQMPKTMFVIASEEEKEEDVGAKGTGLVEREIEELTGDMLVEGKGCGNVVIARLSDLGHIEAAQWICLTHDGNRALMCLDLQFNSLSVNVVRNKKNRSCRFEM